MVSADTRAIQAAAARPVSCGSAGMWHTCHAIICCLGFLAPYMAAAQQGELFLLYGMAGIVYPTLIEPVLEVQFGVFVYLFFLLWQKETLQVPGFKSIAATKEE